ncbi:hydrolase 2, exosortase A system-associated [Massilia sp. DWR3-1-1]|uniref:hydrolase 2, exosortase A system-associated n=1 Tax=Massilia sp. DWR3-1-1 TaxID=2804559 RepID=UPI003CF406CE
MTRLETFFLNSNPGQRFCLFHAPVGPCRGAILYVHPFAEEMNRSRRMVGLQARQMAAMGYGVLLLDLFGCGDSSGDFGDADWQIWKRDIARGEAWLRERLDQPITLWGLRLGGLLALDYARNASSDIGGIVLWQPVSNGAAYLTQFLRLRLANALFGGNEARLESTDLLRQSLLSGETIEVVGYDLAPGLAAAIDAVPPLEAMAPACPVSWFEAGVGPQLSTNTNRLSSLWQHRGVDLRVYAVRCPPFWSATEIVACDEWLDATSAIFRESSDGI